MSRSNPSENTPNPATRWFAWNGEQGSVRYYDREAKKTVELGAAFTFVLLDQLASMGGWHDESASGISSNQVRDTRQDVLLVRAAKGGTIAEGLYRAIKAEAAVKGAHFEALCYIAYRRGDALSLGVLKIKGAALHAWTEFSKAHRAELMKKAIAITGFEEGKKGRVIYRVPTFAIRDLSAADEREAVKLDRELQTYLTGYLTRTKRDQADVSQVREDADDDGALAPPDDEPPFVPEDGDIPF